MEDLRKQANDLLVFYGKMQNRLSQAGVDDPSSLVTLFNQLQRGLQSVDHAELEPAVREVERLIESLGRMKGDLQVLLDLKQRVEKTSQLVGERPARADDRRIPLDESRREVRRADRPGPQIVQ
jgi:hypothetical protein